jgi:hypothetical protein
MVSHVALLLLCGETIVSFVQNVLACVYVTGSQTDVPTVIINCDSN